MGTLWHIGLPIPQLEFLFSYISPTLQGVLLRTRKTELYFSNYAYTAALLFFK